jgi:NADH:ubiquinone oxidoreductase subunit H
MPRKTLGALRSAAQMVPYEVSISLILINVLICSGSLNFTDFYVSVASLERSCVFLARVETRETVFF